MGRVRDTGDVIARSGASGASPAVAAAAGSAVPLSTLTRRLVLRTVAVVCALVAVGWLGAAASLHSTAVGIGVAVLAGVAGSLALVGSFLRCARRFEQGRHETEVQFRRLVEQLPLVVYVDELSDGSPNLYTSPQVEDILGYSCEEWLEDRELFVKLLHPEDRERVLAEIRESHAGGDSFASEYRLTARDGRHVWFRDESVHVRGPDGTPLYAQGYLLDITAQKEAEGRLKTLAFTDTLTGLANRARLVDLLAEAGAPGAAGAALFFLDVDDFKTVNDSLGHEAGDRVLRAVGERLRAVVRPTDVVARLGGDEFALLLPEVGVDVVVDLAERICRAVRKPVDVSGREILPSVSVGVATTATSDDLLRDADTAMYVAKEAGGGTHRLFEPSMHAAMVEKLEFAADLRQARPHDQLFLEYQPVYDLGTGRIAALEALVRWRHPRRGVVPPLEFLPVAESAGQITAIGRWVLERACSDVTGPASAGDEALPVSVNVSARQLREPDFVDEVAAVLARTGIAPGRLTLELPETAVLGDDVSLRTLLHELKRVGVRLAIDDFGSSYRAVAALRDLPIDTVKLDARFVARLDAPAEQTLVRGVVELARAAEVALVAKGLDDPAQVALARAAGCDAAQGFALARPAPIEEVAALRDAGPHAAPLRVVG